MTKNSAVKRTVSKTLSLVLIAALLGGWQPISAEMGDALPPLPTSATPPAAAPANPASPAQPAAPAPSAPAAPAASELKGEDFIVVNTRLSNDTATKDYFCLVKECGPNTPFSKGDGKAKARLYDIQTKEGKHFAVWLPYYVVDVSVDPSKWSFWEQFSHFTEGSGPYDSFQKWYVYADQDASQGSPIAAVLHADQHYGSSPVTVLGQGQPIPAAGPAQPPSTQHPPAPPAAPGRTGPSGEDDLVKGIQDLFSDSDKVTQATVEYLARKDGHCSSADSLCGQIKKFATQCLSGSGPANPACADLKAKLQKDMVPAAKKRVNDEWNSLLDAAKGLDLSSDGWLRQLASTQPLAKWIADKIDKKELSVNDIKAFLCQLIKSEPHPAPAPAPAQPAGGRLNVQQGVQKAQNGQPFRQLAGNAQQPSGAQQSPEADAVGASTQFDGGDARLTSVCPPPGATTGPQQPGGPISTAPPPSPPVSNKDACINGIKCHPGDTPEGGPADMHRLAALGIMAGVGAVMGYAFAFALALTPMGAACMMLGMAAVTMGLTYLAWNPLSPPSPAPAPAAAGPDASGSTPSTNTPAPASPPAAPNNS